MKIWFDTRTSMRSFKHIDDPRAFEVLADETRRRVVYLLRAKEMTVSQIADALDKTPQVIYYHIKKLQEVGLVEVSREERVDHFIETYFRATAEVFEFTHGKAAGHEKEKQVREALEGLKTIGLTFDVDEKTLGKIADVTGHEVGLDPEMEEKISQLPDVGFYAKQVAYELARLATMTDKQMDKMLNDHREMRRLLLSSLGKKESKQKKD
jgi:DNA-binding transcriptional ArsR family regulator